MFAAKFKRALSEGMLNELGKATRYCHRVRQLTPYRMVMTLMALFAGTRVESLADLQRGFNALFGYTMEYKPFYDQLAKREFAGFMRETARRLLETLVIRVLGMPQGGAFSEFRRIVIQDGSSFAIKDALKEVFPGRFKKVKPAAVELHTTLDLLDESLSKVTLTADTASERAALPEASSLRGSLLLADRGYLDRDYLSALSKAGASFIIRAPKGLNPKVLEAFDAQGQRIRQFCGKPLKTLRIAKRGAVDLRVRWQVQDQWLDCRLIVTWNSKTREFQYLATNLPPERYCVYDVAKAYRLRWQVELLFKEWKSYANLHAFDTQNPAIVEGLIWAAIGAAALKRFLAHTAQVVAGVETSTRKAAMCAVHILHGIMRALISGIDNPFLDAFAWGIDYLAGNAKRAHPKRDRKRGRLQFGLEPIFGIP
ncbi:MAG: IS4 family transposase [Acidobacteria bacterium]|nr:IS4 family transposase [Acidobacteriota bacterium]